MASVQKKKKDSENFIFSGPMTQMTFIWMHCWMETKRNLWWLVSLCQKVYKYHVPNCCLIHDDETDSVPLCMFQKPFLYNLTLSMLTSRPYPRISYA